MSLTRWLAYYSGDIWPGSGSQQCLWNAEPALHTQESIGPLAGCLQIAGAISHNYKGCVLEKPASK